MPKPITDGFEWSEGDEIELVVTDQDILLKRSKAASVEDQKRSSTKTG